MAKRQCPSCGGKLTSDDICQVCGWNKKDVANVEQQWMNELEELNTIIHPDDVCPECGDPLYDKSQCQNCGWIMGESDEESVIQQLMDLHGVSYDKAKRIYESGIDSFEDFVQSIYERKEKPPATEEPIEVKSEAGLLVEESDLPSPEETDISEDDLSSAFLGFLTDDLMEEEGAISEPEPAEEGLIATRAVAPPPHATGVVKPASKPSTKKPGARKARAHAPASPVTATKIRGQKAVSKTRKAGVVKAAKTKATTRAPSPRTGPSKVQSMQVREGTRFAAGNRTISRTEMHYFPPRHPLEKWAFLIVILIGIVGYVVSLYSYMDTKENHSISLIMLSAAMIVVGVNIGWDDLSMAQGPGSGKVSVMQMGKKEKKKFDIEPIPPPGVKIGEKPKRRKRAVREVAPGTPPVKSKTKQTAPSQEQSKPAPKQTPQPPQMVEEDVPELSLDELDDLEYDDDELMEETVAEPEPIPEPEPVVETEPTPEPEPIPEPEPEPVVETEPTPEPEPIPEPDPEPIVETEPTPEPAPPKKKSATKDLSSILAELEDIEKSL